MRDRVTASYEEREARVLEVTDREDCDAQEAVVLFDGDTDPSTVRVPPHHRMKAGHRDESQSERVGLRRRKLRGRNRHSRWEVSEVRRGRDAGAGLPCLYIYTTGGGPGSSGPLSDTGGTTEITWPTPPAQVLGNDEWFVSPAEGRFSVPDGVGGGNALYVVSGNVHVAIDDDGGAGTDVQLGLSFDNVEIFRMDPVRVVNDVGFEARALSFPFSLTMWGGFTDARFRAYPTNTGIGASSDVTVIYTLTDVTITRLSDNAPDASL